MAEGVRHHCGGIRSLRRLLNGEHAGAIRYDLLHIAGVHTEDLGVWMGWHEFADFLEHYPPTPKSAIYRAVHPHDWWYDTPTQLQAAQLQALQGANWQRSGGKGRKPTLFGPERSKPERQQPANVIPIDQIKDRLAERQRQARERSS